jgi:histone H3/H4
MVDTVAKDFAAHAGRKNVKGKDVEVMRTMAAMMSFSTR